MKKTKELLRMLATLVLTVSVILGCVCFSSCGKSKTFEVDGVTYEYVNKGLTDEEGNKWSYIKVVDTGNKSEITVPAEYDGKAIEMFRGFEADDLSGIKKVVVSEGITVIGDGCFKNLVDLEEIVLPASLESIKDYAIVGCVSLKTLMIPEGVKLTSTQQTNGTRIFGNGGSYSGTGSSCPRLSELWVKSDEMARMFYERGANPINEFNGAGTSGLEYDGDFVYCISVNGKNDDGKPIVYLVQYTGDAEVVSVDAPEGFDVRIKEGAFLGNESVKTIIIEDGVTQIGYGAFAGCTSLETVEIPESVERMYNMFATSTFEELEYSSCTALKIIEYGGTYAEWDSHDWTVGDGCNLKCQ